MKSAAVFVGLCAVAIPAWWLVLFQSPEWRRFFVPDSAWAGFRFVVVPDLLLATATGIVTLQMARGRVPVLFDAVLGGWVYATAFSVAWAVSVGAPTSGPALMVAALVGFVLVWYAVVPTRQASRR